MSSVQRSIMSHLLCVYVSERRGWGDHTKVSSSASWIDGFSDKASQANRIASFSFSRFLFLSRPGTYHKPFCLSLMSTCRASFLSAVVNSSLISLVVSLEYFIEGR